MGEPRWPFPETVGVYGEASAVTGIRAHTIGTVKHNGSTTMRRQGAREANPWTSGGVNNLSLYPGPSLR